MKLRAYSSISAFLAHYRAQRPLTADEQRALAEMDALLRDTLTEGERVALGVNGAELTLGRFQSVIFAEFDGPRSREITVQILGE